MNSTESLSIGKKIQAYVALIEYIVISVCIIVSIIASVEISWKQGPRSKNPASLFIGIYVVNAIIFCIFGVVFCGYGIGFWRMGATGYDEEILFWSNFPTTLIVGAIHISVVFLGFDRLISIVRPCDFLIGNKAITKSLAVICVTCQICYAIHCTGIVMQQLPKPGPTECYAFLCLLSDSRTVVYLIFRMVFGLVNLSLGLAMYFALKRNASAIGQNERSTIATRIAITTFLSVFLFDILPHVVVATIYFATQSKVFHYLGPFSAFFAALEITSCLLFWRNSFARVRRKYQSQQRQFQPSTITRTQNAT